MWTFVFGIVVVLVVVAAVVAMVVVARLQRLSQRKQLRVEITNRGNVRSRYELRAEDPQQVLGFEFALDDDPLPPSHLDEVAPAPAAGKPPKSDSWILPPESDKLSGSADAAMKTSGDAANALGSLGMLLPQAVRTPLLQAASSLRRGQSAATQAQRLSKRAGKVKKPGARGKAPPGARAGVQVWVQTPYVKPGAGLAVDLLVSLVQAAASADHTFQVISRSVEDQAAPDVIAEGHVRIARPSWFRRWLPYALILVVTAGILAFAVWLASTGVLS